MTELITGRSGIIELLLAAVLLAIGVEFIASAAQSLLGLKPNTMLIVGILIVLITLVYFVGRLSLNRKPSRSFQGFIVYRPEDKKLIDIPRYEYGTWLQLYITTAFAENEALKILWEEEPLDHEGPFDQDRRFPKANELIVEATEYLVLRRLSLHLIDYFKSFERQRLSVYQRDDIPDVLLKNKFMELFSRPMDQRLPFVRDAFQDEQENSFKAFVWVRYGESGAIYEQFELVLPPQSRIRRLDTGRIQLETNRFRMNISVEFSGASTGLPWGFQKYYLGIEDYTDVRRYRVDIDVSVSFKLSAFLSGSGWCYYWWIDSFLEDLQETIAQDSFFESIGWETAQTVIECTSKSFAQDLGDRKDG